MTRAKSSFATRILITNEYMPVRGGIARILYERCRQIDPEKMLVIAPYAKGSKIFDEQANHKIWRTPLVSTHIFLIRESFRTFPPLFALFFALLTRKVDMIECGQATPFPIACFFLKKLFGIRYSVWVHGNDILKALKVPIVKKILPMVLREADGVIANSTFLKNQVKLLGVKEEKISIHLHQVDKSVFFPTKSKNLRLQEKHQLKNKFVLITVCRLIQRKGIDKVIHALSALTPKYPQIKYLIVGHGSHEKPMRDLVQEKNLNSFVEFVTEASHEEINDYYNLSDVFIMLSQSDLERGEVEGLGLVYLEASQCGLPVIATDSGGVSDVVKQGVNGLLIDPGADSSAVENAIERLIKDEALRRRLGRGAIELSENAPRLAAGNSGL